jgi:hypothetical protein
MKEIKISYDKQNIIKFMTTKSVLQKILRGILHTEEEGKCNHQNMSKNKTH